MCPYSFIVQHAVMRQKWTRIEPMVIAKAADSCPCAIYPDSSQRNICSEQDSVDFPETEWFWSYHNLNFDVAIRKPLGVVNSI